ncbi:MAG TPA: 2'-5' RNA ligase family protein [candidate division Zixibacteria bacterium]|mgnify:CR=1 FL=1|nr:2'-5' RNA ligase family protein [candidate division Zixibacteria bacterium]HEQ98328.1 2'-5' RNA ligase family protein [candidate division Zixibacteria bacterium]
MYGIVSELPDPYYQIVEDIWDELERECGLSGIKAAPIPHFSWHVAEQYDINKSAQIIEELASGTSPFRVRTGGIAVFTGENPIIQIPVVRTGEINSLHERIWNAIQPAAKNMVEDFESAHWIPHISLAYPDVDRDNLNCAMQLLAFRDFRWHFNINSISLIGNEIDHEAERVFKIEFGK